MLLALLCVLTGCTTRGTKDRNDTVRTSNIVKFSRTEIKDDAMFTARMIDDGLFQVEAAKLVSKRAHADDVHQLGQLMLEDYTESNKQLRRIANNLNISFPVAVGSDNQRDLDELRKKNGVPFDEAYTAMMVNRIQAMIDGFTQESQIGNDPTIRKWATDKIIVLQMDLEMATRAKTAVNRER
ncbi:MAG TPA: DUF4142 domain-containing protein [Cyclobacteriaceae bacterium]|nr:DUF4142 domain-containing protein [Cyclobacteriaceae bacterium]